MHLPAVVENIILEYYWSHRIWNIKKRLHTELRCKFLHSHLTRQLGMFINIPLFHMQQELEFNAGIPFPP